MAPPQTKLQRKLVDEIVVAYLNSRTLEYLKMEPIDAIYKNYLEYTHREYSMDIEVSRSTFERKLKIEVPTRKPKTKKKQHKESSNKCVEDSDPSSKTEKGKAIQKNNITIRNT